MVWQPDHIWKQQKGGGGGGDWKKQGGKGKGNSGGGNDQRRGGGWANTWFLANKFQAMKGKSKGKGKTKQFEPEQKVWVGNIPADIDWKALQDLMSQAGTVKWCEVFKGKSTGTGCVAFDNAASAYQAVSSLNGAPLGSTSIVVDAWAKRDA
eukprot:TRINITY_DN10782_c0_g1_i4.p1 TRINITY_DN10782_c0_g1~~TRINITY_DN10782_c0_g1_i4.p1  ORF type:complete len:152 (-),score=30.48 TRINITY_DN10782_c0_g1_i4:192-647(-)